MFLHIQIGVHYRKSKEFIFLHFLIANSSGLPGRCERLVRNFRQVVLQVGIVIRHEYNFLFLKDDLCIIMLLLFTYNCAYVEYHFREFPVFPVSNQLIVCLRI